MNTSIVFSISAIACFLLMLAASVFAATVVSTIVSSATYTQIPAAKEAHSDYIVSTALGFSVVAVWIIVAIIAVWSSGYKSLEFTDAFLTNPRPSSSDLHMAKHGHKILMHGNTGRVVTLGSLFVIVIMGVLCGIYASLGTGKLGSMLNQDKGSKDAYNLALASTVIWWASVALGILTITMYWMFKDHRDQHADKLNTFLGSRSMPI